MTTLSRNQRYEQNQKDKGLVKKTLWVPAESEIEFVQMAEYCTTHRGCTPWLVRNTSTGRMEKAV